MRTRHCDTRGDIETGYACLAFSPESSLQASLLDRPPFGYPFAPLTTAFAAFWA